ncbi:MAG: 50S ribosomal protein L4 [marine bacterium B5-7]|nr:MAG: 50S ribosomal protein L4 [marine bacterium B5-7]
MKLTMASAASSKKNIELADAVFNVDFREGLIHQVVTACFSNSHLGSKKQKTRSEVSGGGRKPWAQKGSGRARAGSIRSPIWRSGGRTFAARPHVGQQKVNKKMFAGALRSALSELARLSRLHVTDSVLLETPKTKDLIGKLAGLNLKNVLIVVEAFDKNLYLAARNLPNVSVCLSTEVDPLRLLRHEHVLMSEPAVKKIEECFS